MNAPLAPSSLPELLEAVRATPRLVPVGAMTKPRMSECDAVRISAAGLSGLVEYDPGEYTFTALAGTPMRDIVAALAERGQYLPFDPLLLDAGATLGGTVAAGLNGPGRFRFGGLRDFILGIRFVDGMGRLLRMGGKVVKNAAGFDFPKFFVGSLGRFGMLTEISCKVFPRPASTVTLKIPVESTESAVRIFREASNTRWEIDALDLLPDGETICLRLNGPEPALRELTREIFSRWPGEIFSVEETESLWANLREFRWVQAKGSLFKVVLTQQTVCPLMQALRSLDDVRGHISAGGNAAYVSLSSVEQHTAFDLHLQKLSLSSVAIRGNLPLWGGVHIRPEIGQAVKRALDPENKFPSMDE